LFSRITSTCNKIIEATREFDYRTFLIGVILPHKFYDKEDKIRSEYKIKGIENIKSHYSKEIRKKFAQMTHKKLDFYHPDLSITLKIGPDLYANIEVRSKSLILEGRYTKQRRDFFQTDTACAICKGVGCDFCDFTTRVRFRSIEDAVKKILLFYLKFDSATFCPSGREDEGSLVLGKGRPFYMTIKNPRKTLKKKLRIEFEGLTLLIFEKEYIQTGYINYINKIKTYVNCEDDKFNVSALNRAGPMCVGFKNKGKMDYKIVYVMKVVKTSTKKFEILMLCDNGLPIKRFIDGYEDTMPNASQLIGNKCECNVFDVLDIYASN
jgi:tRNA pseudouridine synthase 10